jgi:ribonuclease E
VERIRLSDLSEKDEKMASYKLAVKPEISTQAAMQTMQKSHQEPAVKNLSIEEMPAAPASPSLAHPSLAKKEEPGMLKKFFNMLFEKKEETAPPSQDRQGDFRRPGGPRRPHQARHHKGPRRGGRRDNRRYAGAGSSGGNYRNDNRDNRGGRDNNRTRHPRREGEVREQHHAPEARQHTQAPTEHQTPVNNAPVIQQEQQTHRVQQHHQQPVNTPAQTDVRPIETASNAAPMPQQQDTAASNQPGGNNPERSGNRRPRRFHPRHRHARHHGGNKTEQGDQKRQPLEGEDIYSSKKSGSDEG